MLNFCLDKKKHLQTVPVVQVCSAASLRHGARIGRSQGHVIWPASHVTWHPTTASVVPLLLLAGCHGYHSWQADLSTVRSRIKRSLSLSLSINPRYLSIYLKCTHLLPGGPLPLLPLSLQLFAVSHQLCVSVRHLTSLPSSLSLHLLQSTLQPPQLL